MSVKVIVSYDGTANEDDAIALGRIFSHAGAEVALAYVRHSEEAAESEAETLLERGAALFGEPSVARHVVTDRSTPEGLGALAQREGAQLIVFCSDSHTAKGHIAVGNSAERLMEGGRVAVAVAPAGLAGQADAGVCQVVAVGDRDGGAQVTAQSLAGALGATVGPVVNDDSDLIVVDSRAEAEEGRISITSSASHLIEIATCSVLVLPRGVELTFGRAPAASAA